MRFLRVENDRYIFRLGQGEKELFALILSFYPVIPSAHQPLSKSSADANKAHQHLLDEALAEQRNENKKLVSAFLADGKRFEETETFCHMTVSATEMEWLLQVLNDIHVGSWILLGSPEEEPADFLPTEPNARYFGTMNLARWFQGSLLAAMDGPADDQSREKI